MAGSMANVDAARPTMRNTTAAISVQSTPTSSAESMTTSQRDGPRLRLTTAYGARRSARRSARRA
eukprot:15532425-Heterocapsa_arctica.AAC.1